MKRKTCTRCGRTFGITKFRRDSGRPGGYHPWCKRCHTEVVQIRKRAMPKPTHKTCIACKAAKPVEEFPYKHCRKGQVLQRHPFCGICYAGLAERRKKRRDEANRRYLKNNVDRVREGKRRYYSKRALLFKQQRDVVKRECINRLGGKCHDCGRKPSRYTPLFCFDFHHLDSSEKTKNLGMLISAAGRIKQNSVRRKALFQEVDKCVVLCAICHRKRHACVGGCVAIG